MTHTKPERATFIFITLVIGGMLAHNALDFIGKLKAHYARRKQADTYLKFTVGERIQHAILTFTFVVLAYTGFALEYPEAWWAYPFMMFEGGGNWRGTIHRTAAIVFVALAIHHLIFMVLTARGRKRGHQLALRKKDFADFVGTFKYHLGQAREKSRQGTYGYEEKFEYWALLWGSVIMILTGTMLTFENLFMRYLPQWAMDVASKIHFYEAVLAALAILVWHFYFVIFDPDHYPMNWSMMTGKASGEEKGFGKASE